MKMILTTLILGKNWPYITNFLHLAEIVIFMQKIAKIWKTCRSKNHQKVIFLLQSNFLLQYMAFVIKAEYI